MSSALSDSDDDDDFYINTAARLKAFKTQRREEKKIDYSQDTSIDDRDTTVSDKKKDETSPDISPPVSPVIPSDDEDSNIVLPESDSEVKDDYSSRAKKFFCPEKTGTTEDQGAISLDDDSDNELNDSKSVNTIRVPIRWKSRLVERLELEMNEPFMKVFEHFATMENVPSSQILLLKKGVQIQPTDTPESLKLSITDVLEGGCIDLPNILPQTNNDPDSGKCTIKIQTSGKKSLTFKLKQDENFSSLATYCAEKLNVPVSKLKFYCDGDVIQETDTPETLDFDDEGCIDLKILS